MNHLTPSDLVAIETLATAVISYSVFFGIFISAFIYSLYRKIVRAINVPARIKTEVGYLYRIGGLYVTKERYKELLIERQLKNKQRAIRHHTYILKRLESIND